MVIVFPRFIHLNYPGPFIRRQQSFKPQFAGNFSQHHFMPFKSSFLIKFFTATRSKPSRNSSLFHYARIKLYNVCNCLPPCYLHIKQRVLCRRKPRFAEHMYHSEALLSQIKLVPRFELSYLVYLIIGERLPKSIGLKNRTCSENQDHIW